MNDNMDFSWPEEELPEVRNNNEEPLEGAAALTEETPADERNAEKSPEKRCCKNGSGAAGKYCLS